MKIKVGIFFGGPSREREISFAGGRTVYDNLNKTLFEPMPIFVDSFRNFILLDWQYLYKGSIRDFYPPVAALPSSPNGFQIYLESLGKLSLAEQDAVINRVGRRIPAEQLPALMDVAFLALHGEYGEDGQLQQELAQLGIPYTGSGVRASQIGMDKAWQKDLMGEYGFARPKVQVLTRHAWTAGDVHAAYARAVAEIGFPLVVRPANQGSSIGVSIMGQEEGLEGFERAVNRAFFRELIPMDEWRDRSAFERQEYVRLLADIRDGLGFPLDVALGSQRQTLYHPEALLDYLNQATANAEHLSQVFVLEAGQSEEKVILEAFISGKEFSCIVIRTEDGGAIALPPTEIIKGSEVFDYRSKYLPGLSRKVTPIDLPPQQIEAIRRECERLFTDLGFQVYARIDGFIQPSGQIFLNDPNTTSGMLPSSFFFHQAAEIGLNPSQFLTYVLRISLQERLAESPQRNDWQYLLERLDAGIADLRAAAAARRRIGVIMGGYSFERHISVESGRNVFEKLSSSDKYEPVPLFLAGQAGNYHLYQLPVNLLLKDNADDIRDKIAHWSRHPLVERIKEQCSAITRKYASAQVVFDPLRIEVAQLPQYCDGVFIALHGRPGEDGDLQNRLDALGLPYNGSGVRSSSITINKFRTLQSLSRTGLPVAGQLLLSVQDFQQNRQAFFSQVEECFSYPLVAKPVDDGCSSAVKVIRNREQLEAYVYLLYADPGYDEAAARRVLKLKPKEEFPTKTEILFEQLITAEGAPRFLEITGGMLTHYQPDGGLRYEVFEPSEALASGEVLSLEEKFLAGEGQNLTPARLAHQGYSYEHVVSQVKRDLEKAARLLDVQGYCRIDAFVRVFPDGRAETQVIEINSLPGMTPATAIFHQAAIAGYKPYEFIDQLLEFGFERERRRRIAAQPAAEVAPATPPVAPTPIITAEPEPEPAPAPTSLVPPATPTPTPNANIVMPASGDGYRPPARWQKALEFLMSRYFLSNLALMAAFVVGVVFLIQLLLNLYTLHGQSRQVANYVGMSLGQAIDAANDRGFRIVVDSADYNPDIEPLRVLQQSPAYGARVKKKRSIYLTVSPVNRKKVRLPSLVGNYDYEQYTRQLKIKKLRFSIKEQVYDPKQEENTILYFFHGSRRITDEDLRRGVEIPQGEQLDFVVTVRNTGTVEIPFLICKTYEEASFLLSGLRLTIGAIEGDGPNRNNLYVYKQAPAYQPGAMAPIGTPVTLYLTDVKPTDCDEPIFDTTDSAADSLSNGEQ